MSVIGGLGIGVRVDDHEDDVALAPDIADALRRRERLQTPHGRTHGDDVRRHVELSFRSTVPDPRGEDDQRREGAHDDGIDKRLQARDHGFTHRFIGLGGGVSDR